MTKQIAGQIKKGSLTKTHENDAGLDIRSAETITIPARESRLIKTGLIISVPEGHVGMIKSRSGLSVKHHLEVGAGVIDCGYVGEVKVHLYNHGYESYCVAPGDKIAQLLTIPVNLSYYEQVDEFSEDSERGNNGFNSTGYN
jgi:dUTP pyrophosphatase